MSESNESTENRLEEELEEDDEDDVFAAEAEIRGESY
jgi:hypothetical protein